MNIYRFEWGLVIAFVIAETREDALEKVRAKGSVAREEYPKTEFNDEPSYSEGSSDIIMHFGWD